MNISDFNQCSNCGACYNICPKNAISINAKGLFYFPEVNAELCVNCGLCAKICPVNGYFENNTPKYAYGGWHKNGQVVLGSSSGGVFYGIAEKILSECGSVFAAAYSEDRKAVSIMSTDEVSLQQLLKSKYVESLVGLSFRKLKADLDSGRKVLFCGTPCQVAGLCSFLGRNYDNLITCDFACGGLPSHHIYQEYLTCLEKRYHSSVMSVDFRPKTHGWKRYAVRICFENGKVYNRLGVEDVYLKSFLYGKCTVRDYCLECKFSDCHASDITIADFWLHEKLSSLRNENGVSLIICNSEKGRVMIDAIEDQFWLTELDLESASYNHKKTETSEEGISKRELFIKLFAEKGLFAACKKTFPYSAKDKLKNLIARTIYRKRRG